MNLIMANRTWESIRTVVLIFHLYFLVSLHASIYTVTLPYLCRYSLMFLLPCSQLLSFLSSFFLSFFLRTNMAYLYFIVVLSISLLIVIYSCFQCPLCYSFPSFIPSLFLFCILSHLLEPAPQSVVTMVTKKQLTSGGSMVPMSITVRVLYTVERITQLFTSRNRR